ncbi:vertnin [Pholidichthys leucotaenia]
MYCKICTATGERASLIAALLKELQTAGDCSPGLEALTAAAQEAERLLSVFQLPTAPWRGVVDPLAIDGYAERLYPADGPADLVPVRCSGQGSRLFEAASILLVGSTELSLELQVRTVIELTLQKDYYLSEMMDAKMMLQAVRFSHSAVSCPDLLSLPRTVLEGIFDADVKATCFQGSYANMWHVYALSSVLQFNISSVYPMVDSEIRQYIHRLINPRVCPGRLVSHTIYIMWSGELRFGHVFKPDNFVALLQTGGYVSSNPESLASLAAALPWNTCTASPARVYAFTISNFPAKKISLPEVESKAKR